MELRVMTPVNMLLTEYVTMGASPSTLTTISTTSPTLTMDYTMTETAMVVAVGRGGYLLMMAMVMMAMTTTWRRTTLRCLRA